MTIDTDGLSEADFSEMTAKLDAARAMLAALELLDKQWSACGPNSDFGRYFSNVRTAADAAIAQAKAAGIKP